MAAEHVERWNRQCTCGLEAVEAVDEHVDVSNCALVAETQKAARVCVIDVDKDGVGRVEGLGDVLV